MTRTLGIILCVLGMIALVWGGVSYTTQDKVADIGPLHISSEKTHNIPLSPFAGALAIIGGVLLVSRRTV